MRQIHFISGLPRSGSTLLCNILGQNPAYRVAGTSGLVDILLTIRDKWDQIAELQAMGEEESRSHKIGLLRGAFNGYFKGDFIHFDKSRTWMGYLEMLTTVLHPNPKIIVCIRDIRDILCSLELLWRENCNLRQIRAERENFHAFQSMQGRLAVWAGADGMLGIAANRVVEAVKRGFSNRLCFVSYEELTTDPAMTIARIEEFLEINDVFPYNFENVAQLTKENDQAYEFMGLHDIRARVEPQASKWKAVLGECGEFYTAANKQFLERINQFRPEKTILNGSPPSPVAERNPLPAPTRSDPAPEESEEIKRAREARRNRLAGSIPAAGA